VQFLLHGDDLLPGDYPAQMPLVRPLFTGISAGKVQENQGLGAKMVTENRLGSCRSTIELRPQMSDEWASSAFRASDPQQPSDNAIGLEKIARAGGERKGHAGIAAARLLSGRRFR
jgi:hypothetical protein